jgi:phage FluMu gp28-like protein
LIDATGPGTQMGQWGQREFGQKAMPFKFTLQSKSEIVNALKIRMERADATGGRRLIIPLWAKLQRQIHSIRKTVTVGGNAIYDGAREDKAHCDLFWSLAMMNSLVGAPSQNYAFVPPVIQRNSPALPSGISRGGIGGMGTGKIWLPGRG